MLISVPESLCEGRFVVADRIGAGGMALVHLCWDTQDERWCAAKFLSPEFVRRQGVRARFDREGQTMAKLQHPHVLGLLAHGVERSTPFLVMEFAPCGDIDSYMVQYGAMPPKLAAVVMVQAARGLGEAHKRGVVHRDIKPDNLLVDGAGSVKVTDFGIAREVTDVGTTRTGMAMGTYAYMAPEQRIDAKSADARSDVYALGCTLVAMLEGQANHDIRALVHSEDARRHIPELLWPVILKCLEARPELRYEDGNAFADALEPLIAYLPDIPEETAALNAFPVDPGPNPTPEDLGAPREMQQRALTPPPVERQPPVATEAPTARGPIVGRGGIFGLLVLGAGGLGALLVLTVLAGVVGVWAAGAPVRAAEVVHAEAVDDFLEDVLANRGLVDGLDPERQSTALEKLASASDGEKRARISAGREFVDVVRSGIEEPTPAQRAQLDTLAGSRRHLDEAHERWVEVSDEGLARWSVTLGLASAPE